MQRLAALMDELTERELASWPREQATPLHPRLQRLTLEIILRAVFGLERGARLDALRDLLTQILAFTESPLSLLPPLPSALSHFGPPAQLERLRLRVDELIFALIEEHRGAGADGDDVLALLLAAKHEDGSPMGDEELRDELMTALTAGHETTASQLAWAFERLGREPAVLDRLQDERDRGEEESYLTATINEILRLQPVLPNAEPRLVKQPVQIGGVTYEPGVALFVNAWLVHHDPDLYPDPYAFRPERFVEEAPGTYTWIPFGGGRRRCLGASFALLEMKIVLRSVLSRCEVQPAASRREATRRRSITISPADGCTVILRDRVKLSAERPPTGVPVGAAA
jgi:cytochrome P450